MAVGKHQHGKSQLFRILRVLWFATLPLFLTACSVLNLPKRVAVAGNSLFINMDGVDTSKAQSVYVVNFDGDRIYFRRNPAYVRCANIIGVKHGNSSTVQLEISGARDYRSSSNVNTGILQTQANVVFQAHNMGAGKYSTPKNNVRAFKKHSNFFENSIRIELEPDDLELLSSNENQYAILEYSSGAMLLFRLEQGNGFLNHKQLRSMLPIRLLVYAIGLLFLIVVSLPAIVLITFLIQKQAKHRKQSADGIK